MMLACGFMASCSVCPPVKDVMNGKAEEKHNRKKFRVQKLKPIGDNKYYLVATRYFEKRKMIFDCKPIIINDSILLD